MYRFKRRLPPKNVFISLHEQKTFNMIFSVSENVKGQMCAGIGPHDARASWFKGRSDWGWRREIVNGQWIGPFRRVNWKHEEA